jgi:hypothetical protein
MLSQLSPDENRLINPIRLFGNFRKKFVHSWRIKRLAVAVGSQFAVRFSPWHSVLIRAFVANKAMGFGRGFMVARNLVWCRAAGAFGA